MQENKQYFGLTEAEVLKSREQYGANILTAPPKDPLWKQFLEKFTDPLIIILMIAGALSIGISCYEYISLGEEFAVFFEPIGIFVAILLATGLAFYFELKADKEFAILNQVNDDEPVEVIREGNALMIPKKDAVVGDIVILNTGDEVPADGELLEAVSLNVDESTLTGELSCRKSVNEQDFDLQATYPTNQVLKGTKVMEGHGIFKVTAVGDKTENGKVFKAAQIDDSIKTPLNEQLDGLSELITKLSYGFAALVIAGRVLAYFMTGHSLEWAHLTAYLLQTLMIAVTLIVVAVPEGLPMAVTLSLAYSMRRMLKTNNLVRKMHACETMGASTVICTDKTGTLTQNRMSVEEALFCGASGSRLGDLEQDKLIQENMALNCTAALDLSDPKHPSVLGNPTEGALLLWLYGQGIDFRALKAKAALIEELPFSTERKYMAVTVQSGLLPGRKILYVKGAPEIVLSLCSKIEVNVKAQEIEDALRGYQNRAMRTLGFAYKFLEDGEEAFKDGRISAQGLTYMGQVAIADPVRQDVPQAVRECLNAGIEVKIVTGDNPNTAKEIGRQIGLWTSQDGDDRLITGTELQKLSDAQLDEKVASFKIVARARPLDKKTPCTA